MRVRAQIGMVLNLDKCIGCHTCSVTCKNVWTSRDGVEYAWFNNVETKPGVGYPKDWENQKRWKGGWKRRADGAIEPRIGAKWRVLANIFANPDLPEIDDYYEPFTFDYAHLQTAPEGKVMPTAQMITVVAINAGLAWLSMNGIRAVRMIWMISVCVSRDSTNQPVWNSDGLLQASNTNSIMPKVT